MDTVESPLIETDPLLASERRNDEFKGYMMMAASALGFAANSACVKALALSKFPSLEIVFARSVVQLGLGLLACLFCRVNPLGTQQHRWLVVRGVAGAIGNACFFYAVTVMTLGDATVVFFTGPVFSALFASWMLGEPYGLFDRVASVVCLLGVAMVVRPQGQMGWGAVSALVGAMSGALAYCVVRKVGTGVHPMVHVVYFGALSFVGSAVMMFLVQEPRMPVAMSEWALMLALGGFAFVGQALLNRGLQLAPTGPATLMRNLDVVFAFILGITLFDEIPSWMAVLGALTIIACTVAMGLHKWGKRSLT